MLPFASPCPLRNCTGEIRKVGVELEFGGLSLPEAAETVRAAFEGMVRQDHEYHYTVSTSLGDFEVTFDSSLLSEKKYNQFVERIGLGAETKETVESILRRIGDAILPLEIGTPPIPANHLGELDKLEQALREHHAEGTRAGLFYAFALHFNPEACDAQSPQCVTGTLRAFLLLYHWLFRKADVDRFRRILPFINPFPDQYTRMVIDPSYKPDMQRFAADYIKHNPTRNRPLDLLPLLAFSIPDLKKHEDLAGQKVHARPTFHYRLPNSEIDEPYWSIAKEWNRWVLVERLAANPDLMARLAEAYLNWDNSIVGYLEDRWFHFIDEEWVPRLREGVEDYESVAS